MAKITESLEKFLFPEENSVSIGLNHEQKLTLLQRADEIIKKNHGVLPRSCIGILKAEIKLATTKNNFEDLIEFVPMFEKKYIRLKKSIEEDRIHKDQIRTRDITLEITHHTKNQLIKELAKLEKESLELMQKWSTRRKGERTQRTAKISNRADAVAKRKLLLQDAIQEYDTFKNQINQKKD